MKVGLPTLAACLLVAAAPALAQQSPTAQTPTVQQTPAAQAPLTALSPLDRELKPAETALVVIDFQNAFAAKAGEHYPRFEKLYEKTGMLEKSVDLVKQARAMGVQVFQVTEAYTPEYRELDKANGGGFHRAQLLRQAWKVGTWPVDLYEPMKPGPNDNDILLPNRLTLSGFGTNGLSYILQSKGIRNVAVIGFTTDVCVYATVLSAYDLGFRVYAISDGMVGYDETASDAMLKKNYPMLARTMTAEEFLRMFPRKS